jgi:hypothetical protein
MDVGRLRMESVRTLFNICYTEVPILKGESIYFPSGYATASLRAAVSWSLPNGRVHFNIFLQTSNDYGKILVGVGFIP